MIQTQWGDIEQKRCTRLAAQPGRFTAPLTPFAAKVVCARIILFCAKRRGSFNFSITCEVAESCKCGDICFQIALHGMNEG